MAKIETEMLFLKNEKTGRLTAQTFRQLTLSYGFTCFVSRFRFFEDKDGNYYDDDDNDNGDDNHDGDDSGKRTTWPSSLLGVSASSHAGGFNSLFANDKPDWVYVARPNKHDPNSTSISTNLGVKRMS